MTTVNWTVEEVLRWTPVRFAEETNAWDWIERMLQSGMPVKELVTLKTKLSQKTTAVYIMRDLCIAGHLQLLRLALSVNPELVEARLDDQRRMPLHLAAENRREGAVHLLLQAGADHEARDALGQTPLHSAATSGSVHAFRLLLDAGADPHSADAAGTTPLHCANKAGHIGISSVLFSTGEFPSLVKLQLKLAAESGNVEGVLQAMKYTSAWGGEWSDMHCVAAKGSGTAIRTVLAAAGLDPNARDANGDTPLHAVAATGQPGAAEALVEAGADVDATDSSRSTPLHYAVRTGNLPVAQVLLAAGADVDARDGQGDTPLHHAAARGSTEAVDALVAAGARLDVEDAAGRTPGEVARLLGHSGLFEGLLWKADGRKSCVSALAASAVLMPVSTPLSEGLVDVS